MANILKPINGLSILHVFFVPMTTNVDWRLVPRAGTHTHSLSFGLQLPIANILLHDLMLAKQMSKKNKQPIHIDSCFMVDS